ncbi:MAG: non-canonical purine NTP pyrophosphatase [Thermoanaerobaculales bacterium]|nr:non-canonical purine NTP pyrophosphatase [Thermoanaerobaculales bacterium]
MQLENLVFVTSNLGKLREVEAVLEVDLEHRALDVVEIQSLDLKEVVRHKAGVAQQRINRPVLVEDTSLELAGMNGFPGPLVRWLLAAVGPEGICRLADAYGDRGATVRCLACAADGHHEVFGLGVVEGTIAGRPKGRQGFGWDSVFLPAGGRGMTFAEMDSVEKNHISHRRMALEELKRALRTGA